MFLWPNFIYPDPQYISQYDFCDKISFFWQIPSSPRQLLPWQQLHLDCHGATWKSGRDQVGRQLHFLQLIDSTAFARFDVLQLEASRGCRYDYVAIYEGNLINNTQLLGEILNSC